MSITIYSNGSISISIDGRDTGLGVRQRRDSTAVYIRERAGVNYKELQMPADRYSLAHDNPASGVAGKRQFEEDLAQVIKAEGLL